MDYLLNEFHSRDYELAFKDLFEAFYPSLCLYSKRFIDKREVREDIVQDVFLTLWEKRNEIAMNPSAVGYLKTCVKNSCLNYLEHLEYKRKHIHTELEREPSYATSTDSLYTIIELKCLLKATLDKLPEDCKKVYLMSCFGGKTYAEIAKEIGLSVRTVERYRNKAAKGKLKRLFTSIPFCAHALDFN